MKPRFIRVPILHVTAITLWFVVLYVGEISESTRRHEAIHVKQYGETFVIGFLAIYLWDFLRAYWKLRDFWGAYRRIRLEQEAYENEADEDYLLVREPYAWSAYAV